MNRLTTPLLVCVLFVIAGSLPVSAQDTDLEILVDRLAAEHVGSSLAGMTVGVKRGDEVLLHKSYGYANLEWQVPMPLDAVHEIGSVTKQFTTVAMLQLYGQEKLDWDADVTDYLPDFDTQGRSIPVRRLVDHTSGIKGYTEIAEFRDLFSQNKPREELLRMVEQHPFDFEPGQALIYNNTAYFLMGLIIEKVSGQSYEDYIEQHVFPLADMNDSSYCSNTDIVPNRADGYQFFENSLRMARYHDHTWPYAAGSLCSTVPDLLSWNQALHHGQVLSPSLYDMLITPVPLADGTPVHYAMGLVNYDHPTGRIIGHGGGIDGFLSELRYYPEEDVSVAVLFNTAGPPGPGAIADQIGELLFGADRVPAAREFSGEAERYLGLYRGPARGSPMTVRISAEDGQLALTFVRENNDDDPRPLTFIGDETFLIQGTRYRFESPVNNRFSVLRMDAPSAHYLLEAIDD